MANFDAARIVIAESKRGYLLAFGGYLFARNKARQQKIYWRCIESTGPVNGKGPALQFPGPVLNGPP